MGGDRKAITRSEDTEALLELSGCLGCTAVLCVAIVVVAVAVIIVMALAVRLFGATSGLF